MNKGNPLVILGGGGLAREVVWLTRDINKQENDRWNIVGFWVHESETDQRSNGHIPVETVSIGTGSIICVGSTLTVDISIGKHVIINPDCTIGNDCIIEDFVTLSPGCHVSGNNHIGRGAFLGTGAVTMEKRKVGSSSIVGVGAVVVRDIQDGATATGVAAKEVE